jgi:hypothetical protein
MDDLRDTLAGLFLEASIIEHLLRKRLEKSGYIQALTFDQFGILGYLKRFIGIHHTPAKIAWEFLEDEEQVCTEIRGLHALGLVELTSAINFRDAGVTISALGLDEYEAALQRMAPDFMQFVSEVPHADLETTHRVLKNIRLVMDNLPDR